MLKSNINDEFFYWITLKEPTVIAGKQRLPGGQLRLDGATVKAYYSACDAITPALANKED